MLEEAYANQVRFSNIAREVDLEVFVNYKSGKNFQNVREEINLREQEIVFQNLNLEKVPVKDVEREENIIFR